MSLYLWTLAPLAVLHLCWWRRPGLFRFQLLLDLILAAVFAEVLLTGADLNPVRCLERNRPFTAWSFSEASELQPTQSDLVLQFHPWWEAVRERLLAGRAPWIAPELGAGLPLLANGQGGVFAPVMIPVWALGVERGSTVMAFWKLELAGLGAYLLLTGPWRMRSGGAAVGGLVFAASCYLVAWLLVPLAWVAAALPWTWWGLFAVLRRRARWWQTAAFGLGLGWLMGCGLHPETAVIVTGSVLIAAVCWHPARWRRVVAIVLISVSAAACLAWPTLRYIGASARQETTARHDSNRHALPLPLRLMALRQLVLPALNGHPARGDWEAPYPHAAGATGVGGAALALLMLAPGRRRHRRLQWAAWAGLVVAAVLAYRVPPLDWLLVRIPPFDRMTLHRFVVLMPWAFALLAAVAVDGAANGRRRPWWLRMAPAATLCAVCVMVGLAHLAALDRGLVAISIVAAALVGAAGIRHRRWVPLLVAAELALLGVGINPVAATADRLPRLAVIDELVQRQEREGGRIMGIGGILPPNLAGRYGLADLRAYDPLRPWPFARLLALFGEPEPILGGPLRRAPAGLVGAWSVRHLITAPAVEAPGWDLVWQNAEGRLWRNPRWLPELRVVGRSIYLGDGGSWEAMLAPDVDWAVQAFLPVGRPPARAERCRLGEASFSETRVSVSTESDGRCLVLVARPWAPGWRARVDGRKVAVERANMAGLGVLVPAGTHQVELSYHPWRG